MGAVNQFIEDVKLTTQRLIDEINQILSKKLIEDILLNPLVKERVIFWTQPD